jgi:muconolactone D-isomerase
MEIQLPPDLPEEEVHDLRGAEAERAKDLLEAGSIVRIWRIPGRTANVGVWSAADASELHELITSLPLAAWSDIDVTPLARHYLEEEGA